MTISKEQIVAALDTEQQEVTQSLLEPVCVLAGAGTGKTRAITHRIAYGVVSGVYIPSQILAVTFTARAAGEMRLRLRQLGVIGVQARTFHAAALRQLQYFWPQVVGGAVPKIMGHKAAFIAEAASRIRISVDRPAIRDLASELEWAKVSMLTATTYPNHANKRGNPGGFDSQTVARIFQSYEEVKSDRNMIDFEDVLLIMAGIMQENDDITYTIRKQYKHFIVDEYQDVSPLQQRLLDLWLGQRENICVVGDANQTIYSFTGATPTYLTNFATKHPKAVVVKLVRNYRSTPQIISLANKLISSTSNLQLYAQNVAGTVPKLVGYANDESEAMGVVLEIKKLISAGTAANDIAILYRTNGQSEVFETALSEKNIGYILRGGERFFARDEVRKAIVLLKGASRSVSDAPVVQLVKDVLVSQGYTEAAPKQSGALRERWESLQALVVLAEEMVAEANVLEQNFSLADFVKELDQRAAAQHAPTIAGVTLASLHAAKGLEWPAVFLVGLSDGLLPITFADTQKALEEERRLFYVGITRAKKYLQFSWSESRNSGGRSVRKISRFLGEIFPDSLQKNRNFLKNLPKSAVGTASVVLSKTCRICGKDLVTAAEKKIGRCVNCPPSYDDKVFESLKAWRLEVSQEAQVPAYVVFTDATLVAIAESCPKDEASLAKISGVGMVKLEKYAADILKIVGGLQ